MFRMIPNVCQDPMIAIFIAESSNLMLNIGLPDLEPTGSVLLKIPWLISSSEEDDEEGTLQDEDDVEEERDEEEEGEEEHEERTFLR